MTVDARTIMVESEKNTDTKGMKIQKVEKKANGDDQVRSCLHDLVISINWDLPLDKISIPPGFSRNDNRRQQNNYNPNRYIQEEEAEPAWMDDDPLPVFDPAIVESETSTTDPLIHFVPGEDKIAAHKKMMKAREEAGRWDTKLPAFFGGSGSGGGLDDPAIAATSTSRSAQGPEPVKPKVMNTADYFLPSKVQADDDKEEKEPGTNAFESRFKKFFAAPSAVLPSNTAPVMPPPRGRFGGGGGASIPAEVFSPPALGEQMSPPAQSPPAETSGGSRIANLMGMLSTKVSCNC
jgi:hypothetical protein